MFDYNVMCTVLCPWHRADLRAAEDEDDILQSGTMHAPITVSTQNF
jgi:hypothetical protein